MAARVHRPLKVIVFNAHGIWRRRYELSKQLQDLHTDVAPLSNPTRRSSFQIIAFIGLNASREEKAFPIPGRPMLHVRYVYMTRPSIFIRDKPIFSSERMLHKDYDRQVFSWKKILAVILKGTSAKTNWLAVNRKS
jgi:hypothetical protein